MDLLGGYASGSEDDSEIGQKTTPMPAQVPMNPRGGLLSSLPPPSGARAEQQAINSSQAETVVEENVAAVPGSADNILARLPAPKVAVKKVIQFQLPISQAALAPNEDDKDDDAEADRQRAAKRQRTAPPAKSRLMDFLPPPKAAATISNGGAVLGGGVAIGHGRASVASALPSGFFEGAATTAATEGAYEQDPMTHGNEMYRAGDEDDVQDGAAAQQYKAYDFSGSCGQAQHQEHGEAGGAATTMDSGNAIFQEALRQEQERAARRGKATSLAAAGPAFVEIKAKDLRFVDAAKQAAAEGARGALGADYELKMRASAKAFEGDKMAKRKHQIGTLFYNAKMKELEMLESGASAMKAKGQTQAKYGW